MNKGELIKTVNMQLKEIFNDRSLTPEERGEKGESVIADLVRYWTSLYDGAFVQTSLIYEQGPIYPTKSSSESIPVTEADIVAVTPYAIFVIEVKTIYGHMRVYEDSNIEIIRKGSFSGDFEQKNFLRQNEMHCRHLYYHLHDILPDGLPTYIKPVIVMTGKMKIYDERPTLQKKKYPIVIANNLIPLLDSYNKPNKYLLDINRIKRKLNKIKVEDKNRLLKSQDFVNKDGVPK